MTQKSSFPLRSIDTYLEWTERNGDNGKECTIENRNRYRDRSTRV